MCQGYSDKCRKGEQMKAIVVSAVIGSALLFAGSSKLDEKSGLVWQDNKEVSTVERSFDGAKKYCQDLVLDGFDDWRLPTLREAFTIVDLTRDRPALKNGFKMRLSGRFWTDTLFAKNPDKEAWRLSMSYGEAEPYKKARAYRVRCVRSASEK
jgi:hypothetical protein